METSMYIAKLISIPMIAVGLGVLMDNKHFQKTFKEMIKDKGFYLMSGIISLVLGMVLVMEHNIWEKSWEVIITIFGWLALVKGILLLAFPSTMMDMGKVWIKKLGNLMFLGVCYLAIGGVLGYFAWFADK